MHVIINYCGNLQIKNFFNACFYSIVFDSSLLHIKYIIYSHFCITSFYFFITGILKDLAFGNLITHPCLLPIIYLKENNSYKSNSTHFNVLFNNNNLRSPYNL